jgi:hypothetical protein
MTASWMGLPDPPDPPELDPPPEDEQAVITKEVLTKAAATAARPDIRCFTIAVSSTHDRRVGCV